MILIRLVGLIGGVLAASWAWNAQAQEPSEAERDADIFGEEMSADPVAPTTLVDEREKNVAPTLPGTSTERQDDWLDVGGLLYMDFQYLQQEGKKLENSPLQSPSFADLYLDARPSDRLRGTIRGRLEYDATVTADSVDSFGQPRTATNVLLDQMWLKFDAARTVFFTLGRQPIRWGSNRFWNPTDFLNQQKRDPLAIIDQRTGVSLLKIQVPIESKGWNFYSIVNFDGADQPSNLGGALRSEILIAETELALSYAVREKNPQRLGFDISTGVGLVDLRMELAGLYGIETPFYRGSLDIAQFRLPSSFFRNHEWVPQAAAGAEISFKYSDQDSVTFGLEYFFNDAGYSNSGLYPWLAAQQQFVPLYVGRQYAAAFALLPNPGRWNHTTFMVSALGNLSDESGLVRFDYQINLQNYLNLYVYTSYHFGKNGEFHYRVSIPAISTVPAIADGFSLARPVIDLGIALRLAL